MRKETCLNGFWDFSCDTDSLDNLPLSWETTPILVPSPYNINHFAHGNHKTVAGETFYVSGGDFRLFPEYPLHWDDAKHGFYRRPFYVPEESRGKRLFLRFDAVAFRSVFYLNRVKIGEEREAFLPVTWEITDHVIYGAENELIVGTEVASLMKYRDENGRTRLDYPQGSFWGEQVAGIWQDVWLCERPAAYLSDIYAVSDVYQKTLTIRYAYNGNGGTVPNGETITFSLDSREILTVPCDGTEAVWHYKDGDIALWDTDSPVLYRLYARLYRDGVLLDETAVRIGFRTFSAEGNRFVLNGRPINLKNDSWHYMGYTVQTEAFARSYYRMAKEAGVNIIRLHAQPFPSFYYDIADEMGMLLVSESGIWASHCNFSYNAIFFENCKKHLKRLIKRDRNHPSVVMWSPENECIPAYKVCGSKFIRDVADLEDKLYDLTQIIPEIDRSRLISCDGSGDLNGRLPVNSLHYPGRECPTHKKNPITIGEMGSMYYSTPDTVGMALGDVALESFNGRLEAVARDAFHNLAGQRKWAAQICVFNLLWYGLEPLPFRDKTLVYDDYTTPGIKPTRQTPYMRTLNAGAQADLPEYIPNPVFRLTKEAYLPVRFFVEKAPSAAWTGEETAINIALFNDNRDLTTLRLTGTAVFSDGEPTTEISVADHTYDLEACTFTEDSFTVVMPEIQGAWTLTLKLYENKVCVFSENRVINLYSRRALKEEWDSLGVVCVSGGDENINTDGVPVIDCRAASSFSTPSFSTLSFSTLSPVPSEAPADFASFIKRGAVTHLFGVENEIHFDHPVDCFYFNEYLSFNGQPLYFTGFGNAVAVSLLSAGEQRILCGIDLIRQDEPQAWQMRIALGQYLRRVAADSPKAPKPAYFYGINDSTAAAMLDEIHCAYEAIDKTGLLRLLTVKQERLLIVDGRMDLSWLKAVSCFNFPRVLIMGLEKEPELLAHTFTVIPRRAYHLRGGKKARAIGFYGNNLYGLTSGNEEVLADSLLRYNRKSEAMILGLPDIDWRMWNHNAEYLKTVSILKSEQTDNSVYAALSCHTYAGSDMYISQLSLSTQNRKAKNLHVRLLSSLGCRILPAPYSELDELLYGGLYSNRITGLLHRQLAAEDGVKESLAGSNTVNPGLNRVENGWVWTVARDGSTVNGVMAVYAYSPQDRTDFLLNPDTVDMVVNAEKNVVFYLNELQMAEGTQFTVTSLPLKAGWNKLIFMAENQRLPDIRFKRTNLSKLDLKFSLYEHEIVAQNMQKAVLSSYDQPEGLANAVSGNEKHWRASSDQHNGIDLAVSFAQPILCRAVYFSAATGSGQESWPPYRFKIWAGDSEAALTEVYASAFEPSMYYPEGKIFIRLNDITAKIFKIILTDNALKPWTVSGLTILS